CGSHADQRDKYEKRVEQENSETPMRVQNSKKRAVQNPSAEGTQKIPNRPPGGAREIASYHVFPTQELIRGFDSPTVVSGGEGPCGCMTCSIFGPFAELAGEAVKLTKFFVFAPEQPEIFRPPTRIVSLHIDDMASPNQCHLEHIRTTLP